MLRPDGVSVVDALWERTAIEEVVARYCRLVDLRDWAGVVDLFDPDCDFHHPVHSDVTGPADFFGRVAARITPGVSVHHVQAPEIDLRSATGASGTWSLHDYVETEDATLRYEGYGFYHLDFSKDDHGAWRITSFRQHRLRMDAVPPRAPLVLTPPPSEENQ